MLTDLDGSAVSGSVLLYTGRIHNIKGSDCSQYCHSPDACTRPWDYKHSSHHPQTSPDSGMQRVAIEGGKDKNQTADNHTDGISVAPVNLYLTKMKYPTTEYRISLAKKTHLKSLTPPLKHGGSFKQESCDDSISRRSINV